MTVCRLCLCLGDELSGVLDRDTQLLWQLLSDDSVGSDAGLRCRALTVWSWVSVDVYVWLWCGCGVYPTMRGIFSAGNQSTGDEIPCLWPGSGHQGMCVCV